MNADKTKQLSKRDTFKGNIANLKHRRVVQSEFELGRQKSFWIKGGLL